MRIYDISQALGTTIAVWPGDEPFRLRWKQRRDAGDSVNVAVITMSVHTGTHADGPFHTSDDGARAGALALDACVGSALVVDCVGCESLDEDAVAGIELGSAQRLLFHTRARVDAAVFPARFAALAPRLARRIGQAGVRLVGTDAPSMDPPDSKTLDAHHALVEHGVAILENLVLDDVPAGRYTLVAVPLKVMEADSAPVRAILIED